MHNRHSRTGGNPSPALEPTVVPAKGDLCTTVIPAQAGTHPRHIARDEIAQTQYVRAEPVEAPAPAADSVRITVIPAQAGIQGGRDGDGSPSSWERRQDASHSSQPSSAPAEADDWEAPESQRGCYDINHKIADAQRDPAHPVHKFVQAYDEVAAAFHGEDDHDVRAWISDEVPDSYGKYIWQYAPAHPRSIRRRPRPRRGRRSREHGTMAKGESIWIPRPTDRMQEAGIPRPNRFKIWV